VILYKTIKGAYLIDDAIPSHNLHSNIPKLQKHTDLKKGLIRIWQLKTAYIIPLILSTMAIIPNKLHKSLKLFNLCPALYILMQKAVLLNTCCSQKGSGKTVNKKCLVSETHILLRTS
jgi:hypothetical protein